MLHVTYIQFPDKPGIEEWHLLDSVLGHSEFKHIVELSIDISLLIFEPDQAAILASKFKEDMNRFQTLRGFRCSVLFPESKT